MSKIHNLGSTIIEFLIVVGIVSVLMSFLLPAVQKARDSARRVSCQNNLRQIVVASLDHEASYRRLPGGGWGFAWAGNSDAGGGWKQPGGWLFQILPYLEPTIFETSRSRRTVENNFLEDSIGVLKCPSGIDPNPRPYLGIIPLRNIEMPIVAFRSDYAGCGGDLQLGSFPGPRSGRPEDLSGYRWVHRRQATGVVFQGSWISIAEILDGASNTYFAGEKSRPTIIATVSENRFSGDDQAAFIGDDHDIRRWTSLQPRVNRRESNSETFGSSHFEGWNVAFCDGSIRLFPYGLDIVVHRSLGNRRDGFTVEFP